MSIVLPAYLGLAGAAFASFAGALAWRMHTGQGIATERSCCEQCGRRLAARDLVPVVSWVLLRGACRYCGARIGVIAPVAEAALAAAFVLSYLFWPLGFGDPRGVACFVLWLVYLTAFTALAIYDLRWLRLPDRLILPLAPLALVDAGLRVGLREQLTPGAYARHVLLGAGILGGTYAVLHLVSRGGWAGFGDAKLGLVAGGVLGGPAALVALAVANIAGVAVFAAARLAGRIGPAQPVPLGPLLVAGFAVAGLLPLPAHFG